MNKSVMFGMGGLTNLPNNIPYLNSVECFLKIICFGYFAFGHVYEDVRYLQDIIDVRFPVC